MGTSTFNYVPQKRGSAVGRKFLPIVATDVEVFVCLPHRKLRITRDGCAKASHRAVETPGSMSPCVGCYVGDSHRRGRMPGTWPDGTPIETRMIEITGGGPGPIVARHPAG